MMGKDIKTSLKESFLSTHEGLIKYYQETGEIDVNLSGTTATVAIIDHVTHKLYIAHVGDSRAIYGKLSINKRLIIEDLTEDHKPQLPLERHRIMKMGGDV